jgi:linoleoyl-CoA desaturase
MAEMPSLAIGERDLKQTGNGFKRAKYDRGDRVHYGSNKHRMIANSSVKATPQSDSGNKFSLVNRHLKVKFDRADAFHMELKRRVDNYFTVNGISPKDNPPMYLKTITIFTWFIASWGLLVFAAQTWWQAALLCLSLGMAMAGIGLSIQHDGNHGAYSRSRLINAIAGFGADIAGVSSYFWNYQHTLLHHSYTNVWGVDKDIQLGLLARFAPQERQMSFHRYQHIYLPVLYGLLMIGWHFFRDFKDFVLGTIGDYKIPRPQGVDLVVFIAGKLTFFSLAFIIPSCFHPLWQVVGFYVLTACIVGWWLSFVFQTAHCMPEVDFVDMPAPGETIANNWAVHQLETTVDFAQDNWFLTWYIGGLNYQVEHHLFPNICHVHYSAIAPIVRDTCAEYGIKYHVRPTFANAIAAHLQWLKVMGNPAT